MPLPPSHRRVLLPFLAVALTACATTEMTAQWTNKEYAGRTLKSQKIFVVCQAPDPTVVRICEDRLVTAVGARGATPVRQGAPIASETAQAAPLPAESFRRAATTAGADAVLSMTLEADATVVKPGPVIGLGIGGGSFGGGWGSGGTFGGVGGSVGFPVGGGSVQQGLAANTTLLDTSNGQVIWSGRAVSPPAGTIQPQLNDLTRVTFEAMQKAGVM